MVDHARDEGGRRPHGDGRHAVVIGGSLAGLLAAHVLAGHADRVTVVERDRIPDGPEPRPGVPQSRHAHVLLESGQLALDSLLPGFTAELRAAGAPRVGMPEDMVAWSGGWIRRTAPTTHIHTGSRDQLEHLVRRRVLADPVIRTVESAEAVGLAGDALRVRGVLLRERGGTNGTGGGTSGHRQRTLAADLVVDASGRGSRAPRWLAALGAEPPQEETIDTGQAYASRVYRNAGGHLGTEALAYWFYPNPSQTYAGGVLPLEDGSHLVALAGLRGQEPPTDDAGFTAFAARLPHPLLHEWLRTAEPRTPAYGFRSTANLRRRYDRPGRPAGFLATGDALCTFNPIYGQGMSVAAMSAVALRDALACPRRRPTTLRVQRALFDASRQAWDISAGADRAMPGAVGNAVASRAADGPVGWYLDRVQRRYGGDPSLVGPVFRSVLTLTTPLSALFAPRVARAVLFGPVVRPPAAPPMRAETAGC